MSSLSSKLRKHWRSAELTALVLAWLIGCFAWLLVDIACSNNPASAIIPLLVVGLIIFGTHLVVRWQAPYADPVILPIAVMLNMLGLAMIHRLDLANQKIARATNSVAPKPDVYLQITWLAIGFVLLCTVLLLVTDHRRLQRLTFTCGVSGIILLFLPLLPGIGLEINGARLWLNFGLFTIQPGEISKILLTIFFAGFLVTRRHSLALINRKVLGIGLPRPKDAGPLLLVWAAALLVLILERDLGTSLLVFGLFIVLLYVATGRRGWVLLGGLLLGGSSLLAYKAFSHVRIRFSVWLDPFSQATDNGYQIVQSLYGFANGGMFGTGWGRGYPQLVPFAKTDFITSALGEELGLTGLIAIILLYILLVERGARAAIATRDQFGNLLAMGLTTTIGLQTFIVIGGVTRLIPLTGLTTPFLSYGGSSLVANYILVALLIRISNAARKPERLDLAQIEAEQ